MNTAAFLGLMILFATFCAWIGDQPPGTDEERKTRAVIGILFGMIAAWAVAVSHV